MTRKNSRQLRKETKERLKKVGRRNRQFVTLKCIKCKREFKIRINPGTVDLYTDKLKRNYICLLCK